MTKRVFSLIFLLSALVASVAAVGFVSAWTGPTAAPPNSNIAGWVPSGSNIVFSTGNVGIKTSIFDAPLNVSGAGQAIKLIGNGTTGIASITYMSFFDSNGTTRYGWIGDGGSTNSDITLASDSGVVKLNTNGSTRLYVEAGGSIGIGTTSPSGLLDLADIYLSGGRNLEIGDDTFLSDVDSANTLGVYGQQNSATGCIRLGSSTPDVCGTSAGIGIGTISPQKTLHVNGNMVLDNGSYDIGVPSAQVLQFGHWDSTYTTFTTNAVIESSGELGIGTSTPGAKLEVAGQVKITGGAPGAGKVLTSDAAGLASWTTIAQVDPAAQVYINNASPTTYYQDTDHRSAMVHVNSNIFYVLRGCAINSASWCQYNGIWPFTINLENNNATFGGQVDANSAAGAGGYISSGNYGGTGTAAYFPSGLWSNGGTAWIYGTVIFSGAQQDNNVLDATGVRSGGVGTIRDAGGGWVRTYGQTGWYSQTYGGGWYMVDTTWLRTYGSKSIYTGTGTIATGAGGRIGVGDSTPSYPLRVNDTVSISISGYSRAYNGTGCGLSNCFNTSASDGSATFSISGSFAGYITAGTGIIFTSDQRLKNFVGDISPAMALDSVAKLKPLMYTWKSAAEKGTKEQAGFFAQDVIGAIPEAVFQYSDELPDQLNLDYNTLTTFGLAAIQGLNEKVDALAAEQQRRIDELNAKVNALQTEIEMLKAR